MHDELFQMDPNQLARISDLMLLARTVVEGFLSGIHTSPHFGSSMEFAQYRQYVQGDDPRFVDWSLYARTDRLHTKQFQEETNLRCALLIDCSASMQFSSQPVSKFQYARMLAACLAMLMFQQKDATGLIAFHHGIETFIPPRISPPHLRRIFVALNDLQPTGSTDLSAGLHKVVDTLPRRGMVILISDLLCPMEQTLSLLKVMRARRHDIILFQISDPAEIDLPLDQSKTLVDAETGKEVFITPESIREQYRQNRNHHFSTLREECLSVEIDIGELITSDPLENALFYFLQQRNKSLLSSSTRRMHVGGGGI